MSTEYTRVVQIVTTNAASGNALVAAALGAGNEITFNENCMRAQTPSGIGYATEIVLTAQEESSILDHSTQHQDCSIRYGDRSLQYRLRDFCEQLGYTVLD